MRKYYKYLLGYHTVLTNECFSQRRMFHENLFIHWLCYQIEMMLNCSKFSVLGWLRCFLLYSTIWMYITCPNYRSLAKTLLLDVIIGWGFLNCPDNWCQDRVKLSEIFVLSFDMRQPCFRHPIMNIVNEKKCFEHTFYSFVRKLISPCVLWRLEQTSETSVHRFSVVINLIGLWPSLTNGMKKKKKNREKTKRPFLATRRTHSMFNSLQYC